MSTGSSQVSQVVIQKHGSSRRNARFIGVHGSIPWLLPNSDVPVSTEAEKLLFIKVLPECTKSNGKVDYEMMRDKFNVAFFLQLGQPDLDPQQLIHTKNKLLLKEYHTQLDLQLRARERELFNKRKNSLAPNTPDEQACILRYMPKQGRHVSTTSPQATPIKRAKLMDAQAGPSTSARAEAQPDPSALAGAQPAPSASESAGAQPAPRCWWGWSPSAGGGAGAAPASAAGGGAGAAPTSTARGGANLCLRCAMIDLTVVGKAAHKPCPHQHLTPQQWAEKQDEAKRKWGQPKAGHWGAKDWVKHVAQKRGGREALVVKQEVDFL